MSKKIKITKKEMYNANVYKSKFVRVFTDLISAKKGEHYEACEEAAELTDGKCAYCGKELTYEEGGVRRLKSEEVAWDHAHPQVHGNLFVKGNVLLSCVECNSSKGGSSAEDYYRARQNAKMEVLPNFLELYKPHEAVYLENYPEYYDCLKSFEYTSIDSSIVQKEKSEQFTNAIMRKFLLQIDETDFSPTSLPSYYASKNIDFWKDLEIRIKKAYRKNVSRGKVLLSAISKIDSFISERTEELIEDLTVEEFLGLMNEFNETVECSNSDYSRTFNFALDEKTKNKEALEEACLESIDGLMLSDSTKASYRSFLSSFLKDFAVRTDNALPETIPNRLFREDFLESYTYNSYNGSNFSVVKDIIYREFTYLKEDTE